MGNIYGYVRVSSIDQNEDRQLIVMDENNVPKGNVYIDKQSGKDWDKGKLSTAETLKLCNMSESTFYRRRREYNLTHK